jgi:hypothetical protein
MAMSCEFIPEKLLFISGICRIFQINFPEVFSTLGTSCILTNREFPLAKKAKSTASSPSEELRVLYYHDGAVR